MRRWAVWGLLLAAVVGQPDIRSTTIPAAGDGARAADKAASANDVEWQGQSNTQVRGRVILADLPPGMTTQPVGLSDVRILLQGAQEWQAATYCRRNGQFVLPELPSGSFLMEVQAVGWSFPLYRIDVSSRTGYVQVSKADQRGHLLPMPLTLAPTAPVEYFQQRKPLNVLNFLRGPQGILIALVVVAMFVLPKVNPEDLKEMQQQLEQQQRLQQQAENVPLRPQQANRQVQNRR